MYKVTIYIHFHLKLFDKINLNYYFQVNKDLEILY